MDDGGRKLGAAGSGLIVGVSLLLGLVFSYFFVGKMPGIGFPIFILLVVVGFALISMYAHKPLKRDLLWLFPLLIFFSSMVAIRANMLLMALNALGCVLLLMLIAEVNIRQALRQLVSSDYFKLLIPFRYIDPLLRTCGEMLSLKNWRGDSKRAFQVFRGIVITVPVLILFAVLFSSADPIFNSLIARFIDFDIEEITIARGIVMFIIAIGFTALYTYAFTGTPGESEIEPLTSVKPRMGHIETTILLGSVNVLFLGFILTQMTYLFGGESNVLISGVTYAEYARRGFFELIAIAFLSYLILLVVEKFIERNAEEHSRPFKILSSILVLEVMLIMVSAFARLALYEATYGFTTLRLYSHSFIVLLAVVFMALLYKILIQNKDNIFAFNTFIAVVVFVAVMNLFNPDAFIASKNLQRFETSGKLDPYYLSGLSADAIQQKIKAFEIDDPNIRGVVGRGLYEAEKDTASEEYEWASWNFARANQERLLEKKMNQLRVYQDYQDHSLQVSEDQTATSAEEVIR